MRDGAAAISVELLRTGVRSDLFHRGVRRKKPPRLKCTGAARRRRAACFCPRLRAQNRPGYARFGLTKNGADGACEVLEKIGKALAGSARKSARARRDECVFNGALCVLGAFAGKKMR